MNDRRNESGDGAAASPSRAVRAIRQAGRTFSAFSIPAYRYLWCSSVASTTAMQVQMFARALLAFELGDSAGAIGLVVLAQAIPQMTLSMVGGTIADRFDRRVQMMLVQAVKAFVAVIVTVMVMADVMTVTYLFIVGLAQGFIMAFSGPARQAIVPEIVGRRELMNAIALNNAAQNLSRIGAPSLAAAIVSLSFVDIEGLYIFQAGLDIVALVLLFFLPALSRGEMLAVDRDPADAAAPRRRGPASGSSMLHELVGGYRYIFASPILVTLLLIGLVPTLLGQSYQQFLPVFAKDVFGNGVDRNAGAIGMMGTMSGIGALAGSLTVASLADYKRRTLLQLTAGVGFGLFMFTFAMMNVYALAVAALVGVGFMTAFLQSLNSTMIMTASDPAYHGRVMSVNMLNFSFAAVGAFVIGYLIDWLHVVTIAGLTLQPVQVAYGGVGILITLFILSVTVFNPSYRRLEQSDLRRFGEMQVGEPETSAARREPGTPAEPLTGRNAAR